MLEGLAIAFVTVAGILVGSVGLLALMSVTRPGGHTSDCAIHNGPAEPAGRCDCGATHGN